MLCLQATARPAEITLTPTERFAEVQDLNPRGDRLLRCEVPENEFSLTIKDFVSPAGKTELLPIPILNGYTSVNVHGLSHEGQVVGYATRPLGNSQGSQRGFVWNWADGSLVELRPPNSFVGSCAFDISADGQAVSGFILGRNPPRLLPCVWQQQAGQWSCQPLSTDALFNPFLTSGHVAISDNGRLVAASVAKSDEVGGGNQLHIWTRGPNGKWSRQRIVDYGVHVADINDQGVVAGRITRQGKRRGFVYDPATGVHELKPLPGDVHLTPTDVNNRGEVVGFSDDPPGPEGGSTAFIWDVRKPQLRPLDFGVNDLFSTAQKIDDLSQVGGWIAWHPEDAADSVQSGTYVLKTGNR